MFSPETQMTTAPDITAVSVNLGHDPRAVSVAQEIHDLIDAECVILFGSRSREGWTDRSDIDIMVITEEPPTQIDESRIANSTEKVLGRTYVESPPIDLVMLSAEQYPQALQEHQQRGSHRGTGGHQVDSEPRRLRRARV